MVNSQELALELFEGKLTKKDLLEFLSTSEYNEVIRRYEFLQKEKQWVIRQMIAESLKQIQNDREGYYSAVGRYESLIEDVNRLKEELAEKTRIADTVHKLEADQPVEMDEPFRQKILESLEEFIDTNDFEDVFYRLKEELEWTSRLADEATERYVEAKAKHSHLRKRYEEQAALSTLSVVGSALADLANALQL